METQNTANTTGAMPTTVAPEMLQSYTFGNVLSQENGLTVFFESKDAFKFSHIISKVIDSNFEELYLSKCAEIERLRSQKQKETFVFSTENLGKVGTTIERYEIDLNKLEVDSYYLQENGDINPFFELYMNLQEHINNCIYLMVHDIKAKNFDSTAYKLTDISSLLMQIGKATKRIS